jgi:protein-disulfide isomerase
VIDAAALREASRSGTLDAIATLQAGGPPQAASGTSDTPAADTSVVVREANRRGDKNAPIVVVEFSDFQCPFCGRFFRTVEPDVRKQYIDTGKVTFVYKHMAILGQESIWAGEAAECAADQGKFWEYHDLVFSRQSGENQGAFTKENLLGFAKELNLDMNKFEPCLKNDQTLDRVQADTQEGQAAGVRGTPTFFINGQPIVGAQPLEAFQAAFDKASNRK